MDAKPDIAGPEEMTDEFIASRRAEATSFRDRLLGSTPAAAWRPTEVGDYLVGVVELRGSRIDNFGQEYPTVTLVVREGLSHGEPLVEGERLTVHGKPIVLRRELTAASPVEGEVIGVVRHAGGTNAQGDDYKRFVVMVEGRAGGGNAWRSEPQDEEKGDDSIPF